MDQLELEKNYIILSDFDDIISSRGSNNAIFSNQFVFERNIARPIFLYNL